MEYHGILSHWHGAILKHLTQLTEADWSRLKPWILDLPLVNHLVNRDLMTSCCAATLLFGPGHRMGKSDFNGLNMFQCQTSAIQIAPTPPHQASEQKKCVGVSMCKLQWRSTSSMIHLMSFPFLSILHLHLCLSVPFGVHQLRPWVWRCHGSPWYRGPKPPPQDAPAMDGSVMACTTCNAVQMQPTTPTSGNTVQHSATPRQWSAWRHLETYQGMLTPSLHTNWKPRTMIIHEGQTTQTSCNYLNRLNRQVWISKNGWFTLI